MADVRERARRERIRVLLRTRNDAFPTVRAKAIPYTTAGPAPGRKRRCPGCEGTGKVRLTQQCPVCEGVKTIQTDGYVGRVSSKDDKTPDTMTPEATDAEISRLKTSIALSEGRADPNEKYGWERARERQYASGSYRELELALEVLRDREPLVWEFLMWIYGPLEVEMDRYSTVREDFAIGQLSKLMPRQINIPKPHREQMKAERMEKARVMLKAGATIEEIAWEVMAPERLVQDLLKKGV